MRRAVILLALVAAASTQLPAQSDPPASPIVIRAGLLVDTENGTANRNQTVVVENGKISQIGGSVVVPPNARTVDLSNVAVLPGLFDAHTHLCFEFVPGRDVTELHTALTDPDSFRSIEGVQHARAMLEAGFTTVRDLGNSGNYACTSLRRAVDQGRVPGPTVLDAGRMITPYGGQFHLQPERRDLTGPEYFFADTRDEMLRAVRENVHYGARVIKIVVDDQPYIYSIDDIKFIVDEAARAGVKVAAHVWTKQGAHNAAMAGVASLEHMNGITEEDLEIAKRNGVAAVFTPMTEGMLRMFRADPGAARKEFELEIRQLRLGYRVGIPIVFGSDAILQLPGKDRGQTTMEWVDSYATAGLPPAAILKAMTGNAARLLGVDKERGAIRTGLAADLIAAPIDPLDRIDALKQVSWVMKNGRIVKGPGK
jgi:imidazolonepropionase-like amidohydrolase